MSASDTEYTFRPSAPKVAKLLQLTLHPTRPCIFLKYVNVQGKRCSHQLNVTQILQYGREKQCTSAQLVEILICARRKIFSQGVVSRQKLGLLIRRLRLRENIPVKPKRSSKAASRRLRDKWEPPSPLQESSVSKSVSKSMSTYQGTNEYSMSAVRTSVTADTSVAPLGSQPLLQPIQSDPTLQGTSTATLGKVGVSSTTDADKEVQDVSSEGGVCDLSHKTVTTAVQGTSHASSSSSDLHTDTNNPNNHLHTDAHEATHAVKTVTDSKQGHSTASGVHTSPMKAQGSGGDASRVRADQRQPLPEHPGTPPALPEHPGIPPVLPEHPGTPPPRTNLVGAPSVDDTQTGDSGCFSPSASLDFGFVGANGVDLGASAAISPSADGDNLPSASQQTGQGVANLSVSNDESQGDQSSVGTDKGVANDVNETNAAGNEQGTETNAGEDGTISVSSDVKRGPTDEKSGVESKPQHVSSSSSQKASTQSCRRPDRGYMRIRPTVLMRTVTSPDAAPVDLDTVVAMVNKAAAALNRTAGLFRCERKRVSSNAYLHSTLSNDAQPEAGTDDIVVQDGLGVKQSDPNDANVFAGGRQQKAVGADGTATSESPTIVDGVFSGSGVVGDKSLTDGNRVVNDTTVGNEDGRNVAEGNKDVLNPTSGGPGSNNRSIMGGDVNTSAATANATVGGSGGSGGGSGAGGDVNTMAIGGADKTNKGADFRLPSGDKSAGSGPPQALAGTLTHPNTVNHLSNPAHSTPSQGHAARQSLPPLWRRSHQQASGIRRQLMKGGPALDRGKSYLQLTPSAPEHKHQMLPPSPEHKAPPPSSGGVELQLGGNWRQSKQHVGSPFFQYQTFDSKSSTAHTDDRTLPNGSVAQIAGSLPLTNHIARHPQATPGLGYQRVEGMRIFDTPSAKGARMFVMGGSSNAELALVGNTASFSVYDILRSAEQLNNRFKRVQLSGRAPVSIDRHQLPLLATRHDSMPHPVRDAATIAVGGCLYVIGGQCDRRNLSHCRVSADSDDTDAPWLRSCRCVQRFDPAAPRGHQWRTLASLQQPRRSASAAVWAPEGLQDRYLFVCGGACEADTSGSVRLLGSVEVYDVASDEWCFLRTHMPLRTMGGMAVCVYTPGMPRSAAMLCVGGGCVADGRGSTCSSWFAAPLNVEGVRGGSKHGSGSLLAKQEPRDEKDHALRWTQMPPMMQSVRGGRAMLVQDRLCVVGGSDGRLHHRAVQSLFMGGSKTDGRSRSDGELDDTVEGVQSNSNRLVHQDQPYANLSTPNTTTTTTTTEPNTKALLTTTVTTIASTSTVEHLVSPGSRPLAPPVHAPQWTVGQVWSGSLRDHEQGAVAARLSHDWCMVGAGAQWLAYSFSRDQWFASRPLQHIVDGACAAVL